MLWCVWDESWSSAFFHKLLGDTCAAAGPDTALNVGRQYFNGQSGAVP